jgi:nucleolar MIF4G domain-containing protein 1
MIGPGGSGLKRDRDESDDDEDDDLDDSDDQDLTDSEDDEDLSVLDDDGMDSGEGDDLDLGDVGTDDESPHDTGEINLDEKETPRSQDPAPATKYVPPHMRAAQLAEKAQGSKEKNLSSQKLERKLQGLLNKCV